MDDLRDFFATHDASAIIDCEGQPSDLDLEEFMEENSTALIEETYGSMVHYAPALAGCATIVICDGYKVRAAPKYRSGQVSPCKLLCACAMRPMPS